MSEHPVEKGVADVVKTYELLDRVRTRQDLVIRDDQFDHAALLDAAKYARRRRIRLSLLDTGRFDLVDLEALAREGSRVLTSDGVRPRSADWEILLEACRGAGAHLSIFWTGPLPAADGTPAIPLQALLDLLGRGMDLHVSNRTLERDPALLAELAASARSGRGYCVVYHHGRLAGELAAPAGAGAWVHFSDRSVADAADAAVAAEIARSAAAGGARAAVHVESGLALDTLEELWAAGAALLFTTPPSDDRSLLRPVERKAARRRLPARACYLSTAFLP